MESLTRLVSESLARHGFDRPLDYRRLSWSRWFRCESHHSLLIVPSKPGVFALAEEITSDGVTPSGENAADPGINREGYDFSRAEKPAKSAASAAEGITEGQNQADCARRMLAVTQFFEDDDMAFVLDRMLSRNNPMAARLASGRFFVRFVVIQDQTQRRSICAALNQWIASATEKATGIGSHFASSLELTPSTEYLPQERGMWDRVSDPVMPSATRLDFASTTDTNVGRTLLSATVDTVTNRRSTPVSSTIPAPPTTTAPQLDSGAATNIHCPTPLPAGF
jgi:hypothetical protein